MSSPLTKKVCLKVLRKKCEDVVEFKMLKMQMPYVFSMFCINCFAVQPLPKGDQVLNFSDAEQMVDDVKLK